MAIHLTTAHYCDSSILSGPCRGLLGSRNAAPRAGPFFIRWLAGMISPTVVLDVRQALQFLGMV